MQRWFFANDEILCEIPKPPLTTSPSLAAVTTSSVLSVPETNWLFKVQFNYQLCANEGLAIAGSCPSLGNWDVQASVPLMRNEGTSFWTLTVALARSCDIRYRYLVYAIDFRGRKVVRFWETHFGGRLISQHHFQNANSEEYEIFGRLNDELKIERGWLRPFVTVVQLKFYQAPFVVKSCGKSNTLLHVKVTPIRLKTSSRKCGKQNDSLDEDNSSLSAAGFAFCEVASLQDKNGEFRQQQKYGTPCGADHLLIFNITVNVIEQCAFLIDLYNVREKTGQDQPPNHFGYQYVMPGDLRHSKGTLELAIICATRHRPIGAFKCDYLIVKPMKPFYKFNLTKTFQKYWNAKHQGLSCGHRGCGRSFWLQDNILRENCAKSFDLAIEHGADMIEFDVQLTKDMIPIVYHDTELCVSQNFELNLRENDIIHLPLTWREMNALKSSAVKLDKTFSMIPLGKFTLDQLTRVKVYEPSLPTENPKTACTSAAKSNQPFITLQQVLKEINRKIGFVVDIKWPQNYTDDASQISLATEFDKNQYIDVILSTVVKNAGTRRILYASSDADICTMVRLKQNLYPIMFIAKTSADKLCLDPQKTITSGVYFAQAMELWGVGINCANIWHTPVNIVDIHKRGLFVFSWGMATRYADKRKYLKALGLDGIICDRLNHVLKPLDLKKNFVYLLPQNI